MPTGTRNSVSPCDAKPCISAQPSPTASTTPTTVPSMAMMTASQRIDRLSWVRSMPTARSRPELPDPLADRQRQGVGHADQGDQDREQQQDRDEVEEEGHLVGDGADEALLVQHLQAGGPLDGRLDAASITSSMSAPSSTVP